MLYPLSHLLSPLATAFIHRKEKEKKNLPMLHSLQVQWPLSLVCPEFHAECGWGDSSSTVADDDRRHRKAGKAEQPHPHVLCAPCDGPALVTDIFLVMAIAVVGCLITIHRSQHLFHRAWILCVSNGIPADSIELPYSQRMYSCFTEENLSNKGIDKECIGEVVPN